MTQLPRYSIKVDSSATGVQVGMAVDPAGEFVRVNDLEFFFAQIFGKQPMEVPASFPDAKAEAEADTKPATKLTAQPAVKPESARTRTTGRAECTDEDSTYLEHTFGKLSLAQIAAHLKRTVKSVEQRAYKMRLHMKARAVVATPAPEPESNPIPEPVAAAPEATEPAQEFDPSNPFIRPIPESAKPGSGRQVKWS